ncbi:hypothetical protein E2C01_055297 [Portunus trituberculatus]|uniref:Uncharacterized protein n=1 Tax=Portunus trituberculatus TaxID=210409 RepID=A0A5B7GM35_PORTR|nr:hypothetical protein [Portunus trituberculatus]
MFQEGLPVSYGGRLGDHGIIPNFASPPRLTTYHPVLPSSGTSIILLLPSSLLSNLLSSLPILASDNILFLVRVSSFSSYTRIFLHFAFLGIFLRQLVGGMVEGMMRGTERERKDEWMVRGREGWAERELYQNSFIIFPDVHLT